MKKAKKGFSLLELLIAVSIMTILVSMLYTIFNTTMKAWSTSDAKIESVQNARIFLDKIATDLSSASINAEKNMNMIVFANSLYFVSKQVFNNGSTDINGYQETAYYLKNNGSNDVDFTDDTISYKSRHSQSAGTFSFENNFATLLSGTAYKIASCVADMTIECWNDLNSSWICWSSWPGSPSNPQWNVLNPVSSNDPDDIGYQPSDPSNKGKMPKKLKFTIKMVKPDTAEWINLLSSASFSNYTSGKTGTKREKIISALESKGLIQTYDLVIDLPENK